MADNTTLNPGTGGDVIASDDISGVKHQRIKIEYGEDGSATDVSTVNPLPVSASLTGGSDLDAFGRLRTSSPGTIFDLKQLFDKLPLFFDESISASGSSVHSTINAATTMSVTDSGDAVIRQTKMRFNYQPGKSQLCYMTGIMGSGVANVTRRIGLFDGSNGLFFELNGSTLSVNKRKNGSDTSVEQDSWNLDTMDGNGDSGVTIDTSNGQIFVIDFEWLGLGCVRFGFFIDGEVVYCHKMHHANHVTSAYMSSPNLPIRYEITSTGGAGSLVHICSSVMSEGGSRNIGILRSASTGSTHIDANDVGTTYAVIGIRLKSSHLNASVVPEKLSMVSETNDAFHWALGMNPTIAGTFTYGDLSNSAVQFATGATANTVSDLGTVISEGYASTQTREGAQDLETLLRLGSSIAGTPDELVLMVTPLGTNSDIQGSLTWREFL